MSGRQREQLRIQPIYAQITQSPSAPAPARSHVYYGDVMFPDGRLANMRIGPNVESIWPDPLYVRPMPVGSGLFGLEIQGVGIQWFGREIADFGICSTGAGGGSLAQSPLVTMWQQASLEERRWLKKQLEGVE